VTKNHLRFVIGSHIACKRLLNVYTFHVHFLLNYTTVASLHCLPVPLR